MYRHNTSKFKRFFLSLFILTLSLSLNAATQGGTFGGTKLAPLNKYSTDMLKVSSKLLSLVEIVRVEESLGVAELLIKKKLKAKGFTLVKMIEPKHSGGRAYIATDFYNNIVIVFRGSTSDTDLGSASNWATDANANHKRIKWVDKKKWGKIHAHGGFLKEYNRFQPEIYKVLKNNKYKKRNVYLAGHSLGGALATLCALDLNLNLKKNVSICTFGNPRVGWSPKRGWKKFSDLYDNIVTHAFRIAINRDPVPMVPFRSNYDHVGLLLQLYPNGVMVPKEKIHPKWKERIKPRHSLLESYKPTLKKHLNRCKKSNSKCYKKGVLKFAREAERKF